MRTPAGPSAGRWTARWKTSSAWPLCAWRCAPARRRPAWSTTPIAACNTPRRSTPTCRSMATATMAQKDPVVLDSKHYKVEFENERVRVLRIRYGPREKSVMHTHPAGVAVCVTDHNARFTLPDGRAEERRAKAGEVLWLKPEEHLPENLKDQRFELV